MISGSFDSSEYRQNTYGPPTKYCDPTRSLGSAGAGTLSSPWNLVQCMNLPAPGDVVGILPGVSVELPNTGNRIPSFNPGRSGTASQRIIFVTKYAAVALPDVANNPNRTEFRHSGTAPRATGDTETGTGNAILGAYFRDYITYDGFFVDMAHAYPRSDSGVIRAEYATGTHFRNFEIKGTTTNMQSNPIIYRPQGARDTVLSNFRVYDFINDTTGSNVPQRGVFSAQYGDENFLIEHFEIRNTERGIYLKGSALNATREMLNYGTIRYGIVSNVTSCIAFNALDLSQVTTVEYNLCYDVPSGAGIRLSSETSPARNLVIHHNTIARVNSTSPLTSGCLYSRSNGIGANVTIRDNLCEMDSGPYGHGADFGEIASVPATMDFNGYYKNGAALTWSFNGVQYNGLAPWRTGTARDARSMVFSTSPFVSRSAADFRVPAGHPARTASSIGGEIGAWAGSRRLGPITE